MQDRCLYCGASEDSFIHPDYNCKWVRVDLTLNINYMYYMWLCFVVKVQCDGCDGWCHLKCTDVPAEELHRAHYCIECRCTSDAEFTI